MFLMVAVTLTAATKSVSVYTQAPKDSEAVYFTPENYNIKNDGSVDVTEELQRAIYDVKRKYNFGIVFLPEGKYKISKTIYIPKAVRVIGYGEKRPLIFLAKNSPGYQQEIADDKGKANYMLWFNNDIVLPGAEPGDATSGTFYSALTNVDLEIQSGNPHAVALRTHFAQHSFISFVDIHINEGKAGLYDVGNEMDQVRFFGGEYGIYTTKTSASWEMMMVNTYFEGQRKAAIKTQEGGLTILRLHAVNVPRVIEVNPKRSDKIYMEDCTFESVKDAAIVIGNEELSPNQLSLLNVVCNKVPTLVSYRESGEAIKGESTIYRVNELSYGLHMVGMGVVPTHNTVIDIEQLKKAPALPANDIPNIPATSTWVNIADLGAVGDNETDNIEIFREAVAKYDVIYIPQGWYILSDSLTLKENTALIGLNPISTQLKLKESTPNFSGFGSPKAILETPKGGKNFVSGIGLNTGGHNNRAVGCKWMAGEESYMNDVKFLGIHGTVVKYAKDHSHKNYFLDSRISTPEKPVYDLGLDKAWDTQHWSLWITNGGGGVFKDVWTASTYATNGVYISDTDTPGKIYAMSVEHHVRNEVRLKNVSNWKIYALQLEEQVRESVDCQQIELQECSNILFSNLYLFRVIGVITPFPSAIRTWNCKDIEFYNVHNFTQMRFTTDMVCYDINTEQTVRPWEFTRLTITGNEKRVTPLEGKPKTVEKLVTGFEYAEGMAKDSKGNIYFSEERLNRIYKWDVASESLTLISDLPWRVLSLACDTEDNLLVFSKYYPQPGYMIDGKQESVVELPDASGTTYSLWGNSGFKTLVYSIDPNNPDETVKELKLVPRSSVSTVAKAIHPSHRWRDLHDFDEVCQWEPEFCFIAPDGVTIIPQYYDFLRSSSTIEAIPGKPLYASDEYNHLVARMDVKANGSLENLTHFSKFGEFTAAVDNSGNVYVADGYIYVYNEKGELLETITVPERPTSMLFGGEDGNTLFIAARSSLYRYKIK